VCSVWRRTEEDGAGQDYEFEAWLYVPPNGTKITASRGVFKFEQQHCRINIVVNGLVFRSGGVFRAEVKIRPAGGDEFAWIAQEYEVTVDYHGKDEPIDSATL